MSDKIHHSTLAKQAREAAALEATTSIPSNEVSPEENVVVKKSTLDSLLSRLDKLEAPEKEEINTREIYTWPVEYSYFLFTRDNEKGTQQIPILWFKSFRKDQSHRGMTFKDVHGNIQNNQLIALTLADGTTETVEPFYLADAEVSPRAYPLFVEDTEWNRIKWNTSAARLVKNVAYFVFASEYGEIKIPLSLITTAK